MTASYNPILVIFSILLAIVAGYTALDLTGRVNASAGVARKLWLVGGAVALGVGIWAMHFIGMLAYRLPLPMTYDVPIVLFSLVVAVVASGVVLSIASQPKLDWKQLAVGSLILGTGIASMHYTGMGALRLAAIPRYDWRWVLLSMLIAIGASFVALLLSFKLRSAINLGGTLRKLIGAIGLGSAIYGMHYAAMAAVHFQPMPTAVFQSEEKLENLWLAGLIGLAALVILILALTAAFMTRRLSVELARAEALHESEARFRSLVQNASDIIAVIGADLQVTDVSSSIEQILDDSPQNWIGKKAFELVHPDDVGKAIHLLQQAMQSSSPAGTIAKAQTIQRTQLRLQHKDGSWRDFEVLANSLLNEPAVQGIVMTCRDITAAKHLEKIRLRVEAEREQLLASEMLARGSAEVANRLKDEFLATLSHELRTPLNAMMGWVQLLQTRKLDEATASRALETIDRNTRALSRLVEDVLDVSSIITGKLRVVVYPVELVSVIQSALDAVRPAATAKQIQLESMLDPTAGPILGDADRLQQIVWNLLANAIKFTPNGGRVEVKLEHVGESDGEMESSQGSTTTAEHSSSTSSLPSPLSPHIPIPSSVPSSLSSSTPYAQLTVTDTGKGIHPDFLPYVFDRFRQADGSTTRTFGGLGLGLAIVRHLVELHGGAVSVESDGEGRGSTFKVNLPISSVNLSPSELEQGDRSSPVQNSSSQLSVLEDLRVLVVDDEPDARELLRAILEQDGAIVETVASAAAALQALPHFKPHIVISDIGMPEENGYALIRQVRGLAASAGGQTPAIALTAYAGHEDYQQALQAGFQRHLAKPIDPADLVKAVAEVAGRALIY
ncbi:MHYT domain-containing protein [Leptolyngbya sp. FACHB-711]|uniref:MHYT domain-containing protein n=1 Tax=unclassified Leptolyngbya TaxID=2650499 RepID=UPI001682B47C|nr:response regulator [Cyanobacteria bacterium FACHB-502]MBD2026101.1 response regulator [Leptolyngbya sp. FACHB-711]